MKFPLCLSHILATCCLAIGMNSKCLADIVPYPTVINSDVCVYGGVSGGVIAAVQAARMGKTVSLIVCNSHLGGMTSGGLGSTDVGSIGDSYIQGVAREFYTKIGQQYSSSGAKFTFEPHVAESVFNTLAQQAGVNVYYNKPLATVTKQGTTIAQITAQDGTIFRADEYIDASYEGDLMAAAGVSYTVGREANSQYSETINGTRGTNSGGHQFGSYHVDPYVTAGNSSSGLLSLVQSGSAGTQGGADQLVQAYNYRICFTTNSSNWLNNSSMLNISAPPNYDPATYELFARYVAANPSGSLGTYMAINSMPNSKTDINNSGPVSTDFVGQSSVYPNANSTTRAQIVLNHLYYTQGLFYFIGHDTSGRIPTGLVSDLGRYGLCKDEFTDNGGWPNQLYVREARRMVSDYVMTQANCQGTRVAPNPVGYGAYTMDSHNCERVVVNGYAQNEGDVETGIGAYYPIGYGALVPKATECTNLIVPWSVSASHAGFGSIRMEPVFMILGQAAGTAACMAIDDNVAIQNISYPKLAAQLLVNGQAGVSATSVYTSSTTAISTIIVDNTSSTGFTYSGSWATSSASSGYNGNGYMVINGTASPNAYALFTPTITTTGTYQVYLTWTSNANRSTSVPVDIISAGGTNTINVDQTANGGVWNSLGAYLFNSGTSGGVKIRTTSTNAFFVADAAEFAPVSGSSGSISLWATNSTASKPLNLSGSASAGKVTISVSSTTVNPLSVNLSIAGTAVSGSDYATIPSTLVIPSGTTSATITVTPLASITPRGTRTVVISLASGSNYSVSALNSATINIQDRPLNAWLYTNFSQAQLSATTNNITTDSASPAGDGISNLLKYATGNNPLAPISKVATQGVVSVGGSNYLTLTYNLMDSATDITVVPQVSGDLSSWSSTSGAVQQTVTNDDGVQQTIVARDLTPIGASGKRFIRLNVVRTP